MVKPEVKRHTRCSAPSSGQRGIIPRAVEQVIHCSWQLEFWDELSDCKQISGIIPLHHTVEYRITHDIAYSNMWSKRTKSAMNQQLFPLNARIDSHDVEWTRWMNEWMPLTVSTSLASNGKSSSSSSIQSLLTLSSLCLDGLLGGGACNCRVCVCDWLNSLVLLLSECGVMTGVNGECGDCVWIRVMVSHLMTSHACGVCVVVSFHRLRDSLELFTSHVMVNDVWADDLNQCDQCCDGM